jgi:hypothetical protein
VIAAAQPLRRWRIPAAARREKTMMKVSRICAPRTLTAGMWRNRASHSG